MKRNPLYSFRNRETVGIFDVPLHSTIHILDSGDGLPKFVELISKDGMHGGFTIGNLLDSPELYIDLSASPTIASELEKITENGNTGWAMYDRNPINYGDIGQGAIDMSLNNTTNTLVGATGTSSVATGVNTTAYAVNSSAHGIGTVANTANGSVLGQYNDTTAMNSKFTVGIGDNTFIRKDGLRVMATGEVIAPEVTYAQQETGNNQMLVTKEYSDIVDGGTL